MFAMIGNFHRYRALRRRNRTRRHSRCGQIPRSEPQLSNRPSDDHKGRGNSRRRRAKQRVNNYNKGMKSQGKISIKHPATTIGSVDKAGSDSCLVAHNHKRAI